MFTTQQHDVHTERDRLSILLAVTLFSAALFRFVELPTFTWEMRRILGSPLSFSLGGEWLLTLLTMGLVATGTLSVLRDHPLRASQERLVIFSLISPALGAALVSMLLVRSASWPLWSLMLLGGGTLIGVLVHLSYLAFSLEYEGYAGARTLLNIFDYLIGFVLFGFIFTGQERALVTGPFVLLVSGLLALELLSASGAAVGNVVLFSSIIAVLEGEMGWVVGYWPVSPWTAAMILTLGLYVWSGLSYQYLLDRLTPRIVREFVGIAALLLLLVMWIRP